MNNEIIENSFAKDEIRKDYKLGKILATSAIVSDFPLGPIKPKRTKLKLFSLALILGCLGFAVYSNHADASPAASNLLGITDQVSGVHLHWVPESVNSTKSKCK